MFEAPSGPDPAQLFIPFENSVHHASNHVGLLFLVLRGPHLLDHRRGRFVPDGLLACGSGGAGGPRSEYGEEGEAEGLGGED